MAHDRSARPQAQKIALAAGGLLALALTVGGIAIAANPHPPSSAPPSAAGGGHSSAPIGASGPSPSAPPLAIGSAAPSPAPSGSSSPPPVAVASGPFTGDLLIADRQNGRLLIVDPAGAIRWRFPVAGSLPAGQGFAADDAFIAPDGKTIMANEEGHEIIVRIDIATKKIIWQYGRYDSAGHGAGQLHTPDDAYPLANGDVIVADIFNCRVIEISPAKHIVHQWGRTGTCTDHAPTTYGEPNGDTPLPDGGLLITEIKGSRVVRLDAAGKVVFDIHVPTRYPSDAQLDANGNILVVDYSNPGAVLRVDQHGKVLWRYAPKAGAGRLNHPSLAVELSNGLVALNDDFRHRVIVIDPTTDKIVWQYGQTDHNGSAKGYLFTPDGIDEVPPSVAAGL
jgi:outer membrane protein assembly factor BamB